MTATIIISVLAFLAFIVCVLFFPRVKIKRITMETFWIAPLIGAILLLAVSAVTFKDVWSVFTGDSAVNPLKILTLFFSMTVISIFLDEAGFFEYLAIKTVNRAGGSQKKLFYALYAVISVLTVFTSNDIVVLTFTPFICYFCKNAKINPIPYLITEFVAANTWSLLLIIGNPTNIFLATAINVNFLEYTKIMALPTVAAGLTSFFMLRIIFRKSLSAPIETEKGEATLKNKFLAIFAITLLAVCIVLMMVASFVPGMEMWLVSVVCLGVLLIGVTIYLLAKKQSPFTLFKTLGRAPWLLIPFVISMFVVVLAFSKHGITAAVADFLGKDNAIFKYGFLAFASANILNNIPMSVLFSGITVAGGAGYAATYAVIIASDIGALLTPVGSLAGIMWHDILRKNEIDMRIGRFIKYGITVSVPTLAVALGTLTLMTLII